jgi:large subunit ribosomal protein L9
MKIILLKDIAKVGKRYEVKNISDGYALNLLIPKGLAVAATPDVMKRIELEKARDEGEKKLHQELLLKNLGQLNGVTVSMSEKANDKGHLFAAVHKLEVVSAIQSQTRLQIDPEYIVLDKPIKEVGMHEITVKTEGKSVKFNLDIKAK